MKNQSIRYVVVMAAVVGAWPGALRAQQTTTSLQQQTGTAQRITFQEAIQIALKQNLVVRQAENTVELQGLAVGQAGQGLKPNLGFNVGGSEAIGRQFNQNEGRITTQATQSVSTGVSSSMTLYDAGRTVANVRSARSATEASQFDLTRTRQTAVFTVAQNFVQLVSAESQLDVQRENLVSLQLQEAQIQRFADAGARPISDLYQVRSTVANAQLTVTQAEQSVELAKISLIEALQLDPAKEYDFVAPVIADTLGTRDYRLDSLVSIALQHRPDIRSSAARVAAAQQDIKSAAAGRLPSIGISAGYNTAYNSASDLTFFNQFEQRRGGSASAQVSLPIFDRGSTHLAQERASITLENEQLALINAKQAVALDVRRAWLNVRSAQQQLVAATAGLTAASQALEATTQRYNVGAATLLEVTQARAQRVQAASALSTARYNLVLTQAVIAYYTGELDPANVTLGR
jgi:outer membrane protein